MYKPAHTYSMQLSNFKMYRDINQAKKVGYALLTLIPKAMLSLTHE